MNTSQDMLNAQRKLRHTNPELKAGSHAWWTAIKALVDSKYTGTHRKEE